MQVRKILAITVLTGVLTITVSSSLASSGTVIRNRTYSIENSHKLAEQTTANLSTATEQKVQAPVAKTKLEVETTPAKTAKPAASTVGNPQKTVKLTAPATVKPQTTVKPPASATVKPKTTSIPTASPTPTVPDYMTKTNITLAEKNAFINKVAPYAIEEWNNHRILPSFTIAQACLESGYGYTWLSVNGQNYFAIKAGVSWTGATIIMPTKEYDANGNLYIEQGKFRKYSGFEASIIDHSKLLLNPRYANIIGVTDYKVVTTNIQKDGYSTDPNYANILMTIITNYNLTRFDGQAGL